MLNDKKKIDVFVILYKLLFEINFCDFFNLTFVFKRWNISLE